MTLAESSPAATDAGRVSQGGISGRSLVVGSYRPGLDGLRGIAMLVMLGYHSQMPHTKGAFLGLSQFFTLSGFLITGILLDRQDRQGGLGLRSFWSRRFRRLMPAALAGLVLAIVYGATVATLEEVARLPQQILAAATYVSNWYFIASDQSYVELFAAPSPVQPYWSLAVEEQFYLLFPLALFGLFRLSRSPRVLVAVLGGAMVASSAWMAYLYGSGRGLDRVYYGTDTRMGEILAGSLVAAVLFHVPRVSQRVLAWMGGIGLVAYAATMWAATTVPLTDGLIWRAGMLPFSLMSCAVILGILSGRGPLSIVLSWGPLPALGRLIYGLYVYHWPIFLWLTEERTGLSGWPLFGLRLAATFAVAIPSYHLLERPIVERRPLMGRRPRWTVVAPLATILVVAAGFALPDRGADDPFETLRDPGSVQPPPASSDGVLDVLLITDAAGAPVADEVEAKAAQDQTVEVVRAEPFRCTSLEGEPGERVCADWQAEWAALISEHDPDVVVLQVDDWPAEDIAALGTAEDDPFALANEVMGTGIDTLSAQGAPVLWAPSGATPEENAVREAKPFNQAMKWFDEYRDDVDVILEWRRPVRSTLPEDEFVERSAQTILEDAALIERPGDGQPKVLVVGDSQARSLGWGLERWSVDTGAAAVWNVAVQGCGLADEGSVNFQSVVVPVEQRCVDAVARLPSQIEEFDPDVVVVMSTIMDMIDRIHPSWEGLRSLEDPALVDYIRSEYEEVLGVLTARGARVVWMNAPCTQIEVPQGFDAEAPDLFDELSTSFNEKVLAPFAADHPDVMELFDMDAVLCPGGEYQRDIDGVEDVRVDGIHFSPEGSLWFAEGHAEHIVGRAR